MRYYSKYDRKKRTIAAVLIAAGCLSLIGYNIYHASQDKASMQRTTEMGFTVISENDYEQELKETASDIEGMSKYDKFQMGLLVDDNSDSDYDGLTDKEEIEQYGTDPLKASSSGDLYTDGYKVANGMELTQKYDYDGKVSFAENECEEIILTADDAVDLSAVVRDVTDSIDASPFGIDNLYKAYRIYNYGGSMAIDIQEALPDDVKLKNVKVKVFDGAFLEKGLGELQDAPYKEDANKITLDYTFESKDTYYILLTGKTTFATALSSLIGTENSNEPDTGLGLMVTLPIVGNLSKFSEGTEFLYSEMEDVDSTYAFRDAYINTLNEELFSSYDSDIVTRNSKNLSAVSKQDIEVKYGFLKKILAPFEYTGTQHWYHIFLMYSLYDYESGTVIASNGVSGENGDKTERKNYNNYHTAFDQYTDELCFQNFESDYGPDGNCLGIVRFTSYLFNNGTYPSTGSYGDISWDLSTDDENKTLMDTGLFDYKDIHFIDDRTDDDNDYLTDDVLSSGEKEFVKMIGAALQEGNDKIDFTSHIKTNGELNDYSMLKKAMDYLDEGKVVNVGLLLNDGSGHAITLYDYYWLDDESVNFRVYDCNIPQNDRKNFYIHADGASYLQCTVVTQPNGEQDFQYIYYPLEDNTAYMASSYSYLMQKNCLIIMDENWNIFE